MMKKNKMLLSGPKTVAMKKKSKPNPFETTCKSRRKFEVLGKKRKGEDKHVGLSRSRLAIDKRNKTLLREIVAMGKSSVFLDKRIGQGDDELGEFVKDILRRERLLSNPKNKRKCNLSDKEGNYNVIRGDGAFLERDDFEDDIPLDESKRKSHKEVMEEVMLKDKYYKALKEKAKEEDEQLMKELDEKFQEYWVNCQGFKALSNKGSSKESLEEGPDAYDKQVKRLAGEMRAAPSDRTKTPEEIALEDKERLEQLEEERQKRMDDDSSEEERSGDDMFEREGRSSIEDCSSAPSEESDGEESGKEYGSDDNGDECEEIEGSDQAEPSIKQPSVKQDSLPFVIQAPKTFSELSKLLENRSDAEIMEAITRIRACNGVRLAVENREKMQIFYANLLMYFAILTTKKPLNFKLLNLLVKPLVEMSMEIPFYAAVCARERLCLTRKLFCKNVHNPEKSCWPSLKTLCLLRLWSITFPCSDFRHVVMTPAMLLMCEYLVRCPITSCRDIAIGSFLCSMVLLISRQSKKFYPEPLIFLQTVLISALDQSREKLPSHLQVSYLSELKMLKPWLQQLGANVSEEVHSLDFLAVIDKTDDSPIFNSDNFRVSVLVSVTDIIRGFVQVYEGYNSFPEIFMPISTLLNEVSKQNHIPDQLQEKINGVSKLIEVKVDECQSLRQPLQLRKKRLEPIKLLNPKFEDNYVKGRDYDPDRERSEVKKLRKRLKREEKGAASELRKDNKFVAEAKMKAVAVEKQERAEKAGKAMAFLQEQQHAWNSGALGGKGKRRR